MLLQKQASMGIYSFIYFWANEGTSLQRRSTSLPSAEKSPEHGNLFLGKPAEVVRHGVGGARTAFCTMLEP